MTIPHGGAKDIFRDGEGGAHNPQKNQVRDWGKFVESNVSGESVRAYDVPTDGITPASAGLVAAGAEAIRKGHSLIIPAGIYYVTEELDFGVRGTLAVQSDPGAVFVGTGVTGNSFMNMTGLSLTWSGGGTLRNFRSMFCWKPTAALQEGIKFMVGDLVFEDYFAAIKIEKQGEGDAPNPRSFFSLFQMDRCHFSARHSDDLAAALATSSASPDSSEAKMRTAYDVLQDPDTIRIKKRVFNDCTSGKSGNGLIFNQEVRNGYGGNGDLIVNGADMAGRYEDGLLSDADKDIQHIKNMTGNTVLRDVEFGDLRLLDPVGSQFRDAEGLRIRGKVSLDNVTFRNAGGTEAMIAAKHADGIVGGTVEMIADDAYVNEQMTASSFADARAVGVLADGDVAIQNWKTDGFHTCVDFEGNSSDVSVKIGKHDALNCRSNVYGGNIYRMAGADAVLDVDELIVRSTTDPVRLPKRIASTIGSPALLRIGRGLLRAEDQIINVGASAVGEIDMGETVIDAQDCDRVFEAANGAPIDLFKWNGELRNVQDVQGQFVFADGFMKRLKEARVRIRFSFDDFNGGGHRFIYLPVPSNATLKGGLTATVRDTSVSLAADTIITTAQRWDCLCLSDTLSFRTPIEDSVVQDGGGTRFQATANTVISSDTLQVRVFRAAGGNASTTFSGEVELWFDIKGIGL